MEKKRCQCGGVVVIPDGARAGACGKCGARVAGSAPSTVRTQAAPASAPRSGGTSRRSHGSQAPATGRHPAPGSARMAAPAAGGRGAPPAKKDSTQMYVIGGAAALLLCVGLGFAMMGEKEKPKKKEPPKVEEKVEPPKKEEYDPWNDPKMLGEKTDAAKRREQGLRDQNAKGEVDRDKVGTDGK